MTLPEGPAGRRANGLAAADFGALVDLDPRLSETLLDRLRSAGVAAYVEPAGNVQPLTQSVVLPSRPLDRLWVDPDRADVARTVVAAEVQDLTALLAEQEPGATAHGLVQAVPRHAANRVLSPPELPDPPLPADPPGAPPPPAAAPTGAATSPDAVPTPGLPDPDELFRQIVAGFEQGVTAPVPPWPVSEDLATDDGQSVSPERSRRADQRKSETDSLGRRLRRRTDPPLTGDEELPAWVEPAALDRDDHDLDGGHFTPPPPPALPRIKARTAVSALAVLIGLVLAFAPGLLSQAGTFEVMLLGIALMTGGAYGLVTAVRDAPRDDHGSDDGAVV